MAYGFESATPSEIGGITYNPVAATYVVFVKLRFYVISKPDKHLRDLRGLRAVSPGAVGLEKSSADTREDCLRHPAESDLRRALLVSDSG